jgi:ribosomal-protein-serine acetyltransferase
LPKASSIVGSMSPSTLVEPLEIGPDLRLEPVEARHAAEIFALVDADRDRLGARLPWVGGTRTVDDTRAFIDGSIARRDTALGGDGGGDWAMVADLDGRGERVVGVIGLHTTRWTHRRTAIGYWIAGSFEGRGVVTRSVAALTEMLHARGMHRVEIHAAVDNDRSRAVATRCGFTLEGVCRAAEWIDGRPIDHAVFAHLADGERQ